MSTSLNSKSFEKSRYEDMSRSQGRHICREVTQVMSRSIQGEDLSIYHQRYRYISFEKSIDYVVDKSRRYGETRVHDIWSS